VAGQVGDEFGAGPPSAAASLFAENWPIFWVRQATENLLQKASRGDQCVFF